MSSSQQNLHQQHDEQQPSIMKIPDEQQAGTAIQQEHARPTHAAPPGAQQSQPAQYRDAQPVQQAAEQQNSLAGSSAQRGAAGPLQPVCGELMMLGDLTSPDPFRPRSFITTNEPSVSPARKKPKRPSLQVPDERLLQVRVQCAAVCAAASRVRRQHTWLERHHHGRFGVEWPWTSYPQPDWG